MYACFLPCSVLPLLLVLFLISNFWIHSEVQSKQNSRIEIFQNMQLRLMLKTDREPKLKDHTLWKYRTRCSWKKEKKEMERTVVELPLNHAFSQQCESRTIQIFNKFPQKEWSHFSNIPHFRSLGKILINSTQSENFTDVGIWFTSIFKICNRSSICKFRWRHGVVENEKFSIIHANSRPLCSHRMVADFCCL